MDRHLKQMRTPRQLRIGSAIFFFISGFGYASWASRIATIAKHLKLNDAQLGAALFALPIGLIVTIPFTNRLLNRYSSKSISLLGCILVSIVLVFIGLSNTLWQLVMVLLIFGSARNLQTLSINTQAVGVQGLFEKPIMTTFHGIWSLAGFAGAGLGWVMVYFNIAPVYHFLLVSLAILALALYFTGHTHHQAPASQAKRPFFVLPDRYLLRFALICFACMACENAMYDWGVIYVQREVHAGKSTATGAFVLFMVAVTAGRFLGDRLIARWGNKTVLRFSGAFICCGLLLAVLLPYLITAGIGFVLIGAGVSCIVPMVFSMAGKSSSMSSASALASISTVGYMGFVLVPPFIGLVSKFAGLRLSFGIISVFGALIVYLVSKIDSPPPGRARQAPAATAASDNLAG